jgi:hypothetical protein
MNFRRVGQIDVQFATRLLERDHEDGGKVAYQGRFEVADCLT